MTATIIIVIEHGANTDRIEKRIMREGGDYYDTLETGLKWVTREITQLQEDSL